MRARESFPTRARCLRDRAEYNRRRTCAPCRCIFGHLPVRITTIATPATPRSFGLSVGHERFAFMRDARCKQLRISGIVNAEFGKQRLVMLAESRRARPYPTRCTEQARHHMMHR